VDHRGDPAQPVRTPLIRARLIGCFLIPGPGLTGELRSLQVPTLLIFGDCDFSPLADVVEMFDFLPNAQLAVLPGPRTSA
jgi:pimeloyl-ACP methyl ester carboxylesterase